MKYTQRMNAPKAQTSLARSLLASAGRMVLVRFTRPFEQGSVMGYVIDMGPQFFLLALVDENIRFNGFQCFRLQDVRKLQVPAKCANFVETALRLRGERIPKSGRVKVGSLQELLRTAGRAFPIITINREKVAPDICHIGRVEEVNDSHLSLLEIGPDARWDDAPLSYRTKEITRIDFGGEYEEALTLVGGEHPVV
jgi:hypothetical protein